MTLFVDGRVTVLHRHPADEAWLSWQMQDGRDRWGAVDADRGGEEWSAPLSLHNLH